MHHLRHFLLVFLLLLQAVPASAAVHLWPGPAPCAGTLQACIHAVASNDEIRIATNTPITTTVNMLNKSLSVTAADGYKPSFLNASFNSTIASDFNGHSTLRLSKIRFDGGRVVMDHGGTGSADIDLRELTISAPAGLSGIQIGVRGGSVEATLYDNRISGGATSIWDGLIGLFARNASTLNADVSYNRVSRVAPGSGTGAGIWVRYKDSGTGGTTRLHGNTVRGDFRTAGIMLAEGDADAPEPVNYTARVYNNVIVGPGNVPYSIGTRLGVNNGQINAMLINNTVTRFYYSVFTDRWVTGGTGTITGSLYNNVLAGDLALHMPASVASDISNGSNLVNGPSFGIVLDPSTITAPARLRSHIDVRLAPESPGIDAGDNAALLAAMLLGDMPSQDADGLRRLKKKSPSTPGAARVDIGAYEYGDHSFMHATATSNVAGHTSALTHPAINEQSNANLFATPNYVSAINVESGQPVGTWEFSGTWSLYNKNSALPMPLHARYHIFAAAAGSGVFRHVSSVDNISGFTTQIDTAMLGNNPDYIVLAMQNYNSGATVNARHTGVGFLGLFGSGSWFVTNLDISQPMPAGVGFSIYAQMPSPNVFKVTATPGNHPSGDTLLLDHPLLNGNRCAQPVITRVSSGSDGGDFDMSYLTTEGRWSIYDYDGMALGSQFNVLVNPAQAETCAGEIFSDGFE